MIAKQRRMKGQYFIVIAVMLCALFYAGLQLPSPIYEPSGGDIRYVYENVQKEMPSALNYGYNESVGYIHLKNFTNFARSRFYFMNLTALWIAGNGNSTTNQMNASVGNFLGYSVTVNLTISGGGMKRIFVVNGTVNSSVFNSVSDPSNMTVVFGSHNYNASMRLNKVNLFSFVSIGRGDDSVMGFIRA